jgi:tryptophanyl-tRNA synthetase
MSKKDIILTGDRPTGSLHLGHYVGSLVNRVKLQETADQYIMIADVQALTDNFDNPQKVHDNVLEVALDYLAVGIDPLKSTILIQSMLPAIPELTIYYMNLVTVARLSRNPTVKNEIKQKGFGESIPVGFFTYPINQVADITAFKANIVPVGEDQAPMIEQTNEVVRSFNRIYKTDVLVEAKAVISKCARLGGIDGKGKMSKSLGNAIYLKDSSDELAKKVKSMYTDPNHIKIEDPGSLEGNAVFEYLDVFGSDQGKIAELKEQYQKGGLGDMKVKMYLLEELNTFLEPIRTRRQEFEKDKGQVLKMILDGTKKAQELTQKTLYEVKTAMHLIY